MESNSLAVLETLGNTSLRETLQRIWMDEYTETTGKINPKVARQLAESGLLTTDGRVYSQRYFRLVIESKPGNGLEVDYTNMNVLRKASVFVAYPESHKQCAESISTLAAFALDYGVAQLKLKSLSPILICVNRPDLLRSYNDYYLFSYPAKKTVHAGFPSLKRIREDTIRGYVCHVYGIVHEVGHLFFSHPDRCLSESWAIFFGNTVTKELDRCLGQSAWYVPYDYVKHDLSKVKSVTAREEQIAEYIEAFQHHAAKGNLAGLFVKLAEEKDVESIVLSPDPLENGSLRNSK